MGAIFKMNGVFRVLVALCAALTICHPLAAAYVANWLDLVASTHR
jgi:hypothetical protein